MIFITGSYGIYAREQPLPKLFHHSLKAEHLNETKKLWLEHSVIELIIFNCIDVWSHLLLELQFSQFLSGRFFEDAYISIGNIRHWLKTKRRRTGFFVRTIVLLLLLAIEIMLKIN